jgi:hypothetical protein
MYCRANVNYNWTSNRRCGRRLIGSPRAQSQDGLSVIRSCWSDVERLENARPSPCTRTSVAGLSVVARLAIAQWMSDAAAAIGLGRRKQRMRSRDTQWRMSDWSSSRMGVRFSFGCTSVNLALGSNGSDWVAHQHFAVAHKPPKRCETPLWSHVSIRISGSNFWSMTTSQRGNTPG